tara:strand:- start:1300 stop:1539 length:240 start_codon:yes stop_codon:yes gene_type:complete
MDEFDEYLIHCSAIDKLEAQLINAKFMVDDTHRDLKAGLYGGVTRREQQLVLDGCRKEVEIFEYILKTLRNNIVKDELK